MLVNQNSRIKFEEFPGNADDEGSSIIEFAKSKKIVIITFTIILFLVLLVISSFLNERIVDFYFTS